MDGWNNSGSILTCQDENGKTCACQTQIYYNYSCSSLKQKCVYSTGNTRISKNNCVEPEPEPTQYPDLIVKSPGFSPTNPIEGDEMVFWATLKNQGAGTAVSSLSYLRIDGVKFAEFSTVSLSSNESIVVTGSTVWPAVAGEHKFEVCADGALRVAESNELNNCIEITFTVAEKEIIKQSDLIIQSLSMSPASTTAGQEVHFSGTVKNQGEASAASSLTRLNLDLDNNGTWDIFMGAMPTSALGVNAIVTKSWQETWIAIAGTHKFEICADVDLEVAESDETNNCLSRVFTVP